MGRMQFGSRASLKTGGEMGAHGHLLFKTRGDTAVPSPEELSQIGHRHYFL